jgi:hypothetical protein
MYTNDRHNIMLDTSIACPRGRPIFHVHLHGMSVANSNRLLQVTEAAETSYTLDISQTMDSTKLIFQYGNFTTILKIISLSLLLGVVVVTFL